MKKVLALVLAFAMMFSTITVAFAEPEVSAEAKALATVGMLEGDGNGVTAEYTAKEMTRFTAAISLLKLKGLYNDALAFKGDANFADVDAVKWEEGKNILAYLKANPGLGFGGNEKGEFNPNGNINEQSYYKVLLETLGYKQTTAEVAGDFAWAEVLEFAEKVGLKPAKAEKFTVDELAKATVGALKAKMKDGKVLINVLVEAGKVDKAKAVAAELMADKPEVTAALKSAKAIGNTTVEVTFDAEINEGATDVAMYSIQGLEVKSAMLGGAKKVLLETAAQTAGKTYTLVVGEVKANFGGKAKIAGAPELKKVTGPDTERVELEFDKVLDTVSALDKANYSIANVSIENIELSSDRKVVTLETKGMTASKTYTLKVTNIKSVDGTALKSATRVFVSKSDKVAPKLESVTAMTNTRLKVVFNELVTTESAENVANYTVKTSSTELTVEKVVDVTKSDDEKTTVEVTTSSQKAGTRYDLVVRDIVDQSVLANAMAKEVKLTFTGKSVDKAAPVYKGFEYITREIVKVIFEDSSRLSKEAVLDVNNYVFNNDVSIEKVELMPGADDDFREVLLTVSELGAKPSYELKVSGIRDEYDNEMKEKKLTKQFNKADASAASRVLKAYATATNKVKIEFSKELDLVTAGDPANYSLSADIGTPVSVSVAKGLKSVTLTTEELTAGKNYTVTIDGVNDLAGNVLTNIKAYFSGTTTINDTEKPEVSDVVAMNKNVVRVTFSEPVKFTAGTADIKVALLSGITANANGFVTGLGTEIQLKARVAYEDKTVVEFSGDLPADALTYGVYAVTSISGIKDLAGNTLEFDNASIDGATTKKADLVTLDGTNENAEKIEFTWEQVSVRKFKLIFTEKVNGSGTFSTLSVLPDPDEDPTVWYLESGSVIKTDAKFTDNINNAFTSKHTLAGLDIANLDSATKTVLEGGLEDTDAPYIEKVEATYNNEIIITYNEDLKANGRYEITYTDDKGKTATINPSASLDSKNKKKVKLTFSTILDSRNVYTLKVKAVAVDVANNRSEDLNEEFVFMGSDLKKTANYVKGLKFENGGKFYIQTASALESGDTVTVDLVYGDNDYVAFTGFAATYNATEELFEVDLVTNNMAVSNEYEYTISVTSNDVGDLGDYKFEGLVDSTNVTFKLVTGSTTNYNVTIPAAAKDLTVLLIDNNGAPIVSNAITKDDGFVYDSTGATKYVVDSSTYGYVNVLVLNADGVPVYYNVGLEVR